MNNSLIPYVIEKSSEGERSYDLYSRLLKDRIVMLCGEVTEQSMNVAVAELLFLNNEDKEKPIFLYIQSPGGSVQDGLALIDTMKFISAPVYTIVTGVAASMGAAILSAGEPGHRYALRSSQILVHPMSGGTQGRTRDGSIAINYEKRLENYLYAEIGHNCKQISDSTYNEVIKAVSEMEDIEEYPDWNISAKAKKELEAFKKSNNYDHWMFPEKALKFGIIDQILTSEKDLQ